MAGDWSSSFRSPSPEYEDYESDAVPGKDGGMGRSSGDDWNLDIDDDEQAFGKDTQTATYKLNPWTKMQWQKQMASAKAKAGEKRDPDGKGKRTDPHNGPPVAKTKSAAKPGGKSKQQAAQASSSGGGNRKVVASQSEGFAASSTGRDNDVSLSRSHAGAGSAGDGGDTVPTAEDVGSSISKSVTATKKASKKRESPISFGKIPASAVRQPESFPILQGFERQRDMGRRLVSEGAVADLQREDRDVPEVEKMIDAILPSSDAGFEATSANRQPPLDRDEPSELSRHDKKKDESCLLAGFRTTSVAPPSPTGQHVDAPTVARPPTPGGTPERDVSPQLYVVETACRDGGPTLAEKKSLSLKPRLGASRAFAQQQPAPAAQRQSQSFKRPAQTPVAKSWSHKLASQSTAIATLSKIPPEHMPFAHPSPMNAEQTPAQEEAFPEVEWSTLPVKKGDRMPKNLLRGIGRRIPRARPTSRNVAVREVPPAVKSKQGNPLKSKITLFTPSPLQNSSKTTTPPTLARAPEVASKPVEIVFDIPAAAPTNLSLLYHRLLDASYLSPLDSPPDEPRMKVRLGDISQAAVVARERLSRSCDLNDVVSKIEMVVI